MNAWAMTEAYVAFRDQGETTRATELKPYMIAMLDNLALEISTLGVIDPAYLGVRDLAYAFLTAIWKVSQYENEAHPTWENAAWAIWNSGAFDTYNTNSVCVGLYLLIQSDTPYEPLASRQDFNSIADYDAIGGLKVFPNPAHESVVLKFDNSKNETAEIKIYDRAGKIVFEQTTTLSQIELNVAGFGEGAYVIKVFLDNEIITSQFVKS
ncbi:MAG: T9SS type A sorting domain-containing protein [Crocinitomicaceae bacterium]|nr:T9SS type A sorting domain-containing protein [Crocinitomicaceae bacterium]